MSRYLHLDLEWSLSWKAFIFEIFQLIFDTKTFEIFFEILRSFQYFKYFLISNISFVIFYIFLSRNPLLFNMSFLIKLCTGAK